MFESLWELTWILTWIFFCRAGPWIWFQYSGSLPSITVKPSNCFFFFKHQSDRRSCHVFRQCTTLWGICYHVAPALHAVMYVPRMLPFYRRDELHNLSQRKVIFWLIENASINIWVINMYHIYIYIYIYIYICVCVCVCVPWSGIGMGKQKHVYVWVIISQQISCITRRVQAFKGFGRQMYEWRIS